MWIATEHFVFDQIHWKLDAQMKKIYVFDTQTLCNFK